MPVMLTTPAAEALSALDQAARNPRWAAVTKMIDAEIAAVFQRMLGSTDMADLHELRGRAKALQEFQQTVAQAAETLAKRGHQSPL